MVLYRVVVRRAKIEKPCNRAFRWVRFFFLNSCSQCTVTNPLPPADLSSFHNSVSFHSYTISWLYCIHFILFVRMAFEQDGKAYRNDMVWQCTVYTDTMKLV